MGILKAYLQYKCTAQRVTKISFFEVTTSRRRAVVNGFHNVAFCRGGNPISCSVFRYASWFQPLPESLLGFREFFPRLSAVFLSGHGNVKSRHVVNEV